MTKKELKLLVKECVKEVMAELMIEMNFKQIIESAINKVPSQVSQVQPQRQAQTRPIVENTRTVQKINLKEKLKISDDEWNSIYATVDQGSPIMTENQTATHNPEFVSENDLASMGLLKDFSKFV